MELISATQPKANKDHVCNWCKGVIKRGEIYDKACCKDDYIYTWKNHLKCSKLCDDLEMYDNNWGDGVDSESFMSSVYCFLQDNMTEEEKEGPWLRGEEAVDKVLEILERD